ncbi:MAG: Endonuclease 4 [Chlamydiia bacterium]|nr:Endonuclease 4 [Chlamydiia bacterium]
MPSKEHLKVGAHFSVQGGAHLALERGAAIGANVAQIFTSNQKQWKGRVFSDEEIALWNETKARTGLSSIMSHGSYLINLGSNKPELLKKSHDAFADELKRCHDLHVDYLNFHPGAATGATEEECLQRIIDQLRSLKTLIGEGPTMPVLETTAGQGTCVGYTFEHLSTIIEGVKDVMPIGVCIDTCHIFSAGYDIRTRESWDHVLKEFDRIIGLKHLVAFHVNDSMKPLASKRDRHANLGEGEIGLESFEFLVTDERTRHLPLYLETPNGDTMWEKEIQLLIDLATNRVK